MPCEFEVRYQCACGRVYHGEGAVAVTYKHACRVNRDPNIVRVFAEPDLRAQGEVFATEDVNRAIAAVRDKYLVGGGDVAYALRLAEARQCFEQAALLQIDNADGIVAEFSDKQALTGHVHCEVIDPTLHGAQWNGCFQHQRGWFLGSRRTAEYRAEERRNWEEGAPHSRDSETVLNCLPLRSSTIATACC